MTHAIPCYSARPFVRDALTSCSCIMYPVLEQAVAFRGEHQNARAGLAEWRTRRQRHPRGGPADVVEEGVSESGKWRQKGSHGIGHIEMEAGDER